MSVTIDQIQVEFTGKIEDLQKKLNQVDAKINQSAKNTKGLSNSLMGVAGLVAGAFSVQQLISFGREVINVTAKFEKLEAQLTTALGSNSAAQQAMQQIVQFASTTPFQVDELTQSFVQFANRGVKPTMAQMENLGDLSAALGKDFDLLTGAIIDAVDPVRWRNLGIVVSREGDKMTGSFKGLEVTVDATTAGALEMAAAFGQLEGVAGGMARVSETLGGRISNLKDNIDLLYQAIGEANKGPLATFIQMLNTSISNITELVKGLREVGREQALGKFDQTLERIGVNLDEISDQAALTNAINAVSSELMKEQRLLAANQKYWKELSEETNRFGISQKQRNTADFLVGVSEARVEELINVLDTLMNFDLEKPQKEFEDTTEKVDKLAEALKKLNLQTQIEIDAEIGRIMTDTGISRPEGMMSPDELVRLAESIQTVNETPLEFTNAEMFAEEIAKAGLVTDILNDGMQTLFSTLAGGGNVLEAFGNYLKQLAARLAAMAVVAAILSAMSGGSGAVATGIKQMFGGGSWSNIMSGMLGISPAATGGGSVAANTVSASPPMNTTGNNIMSNALANVQFRIEGSDLVASLDRSNRQRFRTS